MTIMERIELNPKVCNGKPVIKGTRIPISVILEQIYRAENTDNSVKNIYVRVSLLLIARI